MSAIAENRRDGETTLVVLPLDWIAVSKTNPRIHFGEDALNSLADSIEASGLLQPVVVRYLVDFTEEAGPNNPAYELVIGERRFRAHQILRARGCTEIGGKPWDGTIAVTVAEMSDAEARVAQAIENDQRVDVTPIERARGYLSMVESGLYGSGEPAKKAIGVALKVSTATVYQRLQLLKACEEAQRFCAEGVISENHLKEIARGNAEEQTKALDWLLWTPGYDGQTPVTRFQRRESIPSVRELIAWQRRVRPDLASAPFSTARFDYLPQVPACSQCPKRTLHEADLMGDLFGGDDLCLDHACYKAKCLAHVRLLIEEHEQSSAPFALISRSYQAHPEFDNRPVVCANDYQVVQSGGIDGIIIATAAGNSIEQIGQVLRVAVRAPKPVPPAASATFVPPPPPQVLPLGSEATQDSAVDEESVPIRPDDEFTDHVLAGREVDQESGLVVPRGNRVTVDFGAGWRKDVDLSKGVLCAIVEDDGGDQITVMRYDTAVTQSVYRWRTGNPLRDPENDFSVPQAELDAAWHDVLSAAFAEWYGNASPKQVAMLVRDQSHFLGIDVEGLFPEVRKRCFDAHYTAKPGAPDDGSEAAQERVWPTPNEHGVYAFEDAELLAFQGARPDRMARCEIHILEISENRWAWATSFDVPASGRSGPLTRDQIEPTREAALKRAVGDLIGTCRDAVLSTNSCIGKKARQLAKRFGEWAAELIGETFEVEVPDVAESEDEEESENHARRGTKVEFPLKPTQTIRTADGQGPYIVIGVKGPSLLTRKGKKAKQCWTLSLCLRKPSGALSTPGEHTGFWFDAKGVHWGADMKEVLTVDESADESEEVRALMEGESA